MSVLMIFQWSFKIAFKISRLFWVLQSCWERSFISDVNVVKFQGWSREVSSVTKFIPWSLNRVSKGVVWVFHECWCTAVIAAGWAEGWLVPHKRWRYTQPGNQENILLLIREFKLEFVSNIWSIKTKSEEIVRLDEACFVMRGGERKNILLVVWDGGCWIVMKTLSCVI